MGEVALEVVIVVVVVAVVVVDIRLSFVCR